jgi:hypothetical protein
MHKLAVSLATAVLGFTVAAYAEVAAAPQVVDQPKCVGCGVPDIEVHYRVPFANIVSGTQTFDLGTTTVGTPVTFDNFAIGATQYLDDLYLSSIVMPTGFTLVAGPAVPGTLLSGQSFLARVRCDASSAGSYSGNMVINSDDPDEGAFTIALECEVQEESVPTTEATETTDDGSGAGLPVNGAATTGLLLLAIALVVVGGGTGLLARRRA